jgi:hypothetical protein
VFALHPHALLCEHKHHNQHSLVCTRTFSWGRGGGGLLTTPTMTTNRVMFDANESARARERRADLRDTHHCDERMCPCQQSRATARIITLLTHSPSTHACGSRRVLVIARTDDHARLCAHQDPGDRQIAWCCLHTRTRT